MLRGTKQVLRLTLIARDWIHLLVHTPYVPYTVSIYSMLYIGFVSTVPFRPTLQTRDQILFFKNLRNSENLRKS